MSKNEDIWKTKLLMQQSLAHGAPSPKLSKMLEVLLDHFSMWHIILLLCPQNVRLFCALGCLFVLLFLNYIENLIESL